MVVRAGGGAGAFWWWWWCRCTMQQMLLAEGQRERASFSGLQSFRMLLLYLEHLRGFCPAPGKKNIVYEEYRRLGWSISECILVEPFWGARGLQRSGFTPHVVIMLHSHKIEDQLATGHPFGQSLQKTSRGGIFKKDSFVREVKNINFGI